MVSYTEKAISSYFLNKYPVGASTKWKHPLQAGELERREPLSC